MRECESCTLDSAFETLTFGARRGPLSKLTSMIPGMSEMMGGNEDEAGKKMKRVAFIFDSMTTEELDSDGSLFRDEPSTVASTSKNPTPSENGKEKAVSPEDDMTPREPNKRILRIARGSGTSVTEVEELLMQHQMFAGMVKKAGGKSGWCVWCSSSLLSSSLTVLWSSRMSKMKAGAGGRPGMGGMPGMPALGPGGMPDLSKMTPGQMAQMQVGSPRPFGARRSLISISRHSLHLPASFTAPIDFSYHSSLFTHSPTSPPPLEHATAGHARTDGSAWRDAANAADDGEHGRRRGTARDGRNGWDAGHEQIDGDVRRRRAVAFEERQSWTSHVLQVSRLAFCEVWTDAASISCLCISCLCTAEERLR